MKVVLVNGRGIDGGGNSGGISIGMDGEYVMGMLSETSSLFDDEDWWWTE